MQCFEGQPDHAARELIVELQVGYPRRNALRQFYTLQTRVRTLRRQAILRLIGEGTGYIVCEASGREIA